MTNKIIILLFILTIFVGGLWYLGQKKGPLITFLSVQPTPTVEETSVPTIIPTASLVLDFGSFSSTKRGFLLKDGRTATHSGVKAKNALEILEKIASEAGVRVGTKKYNFGSLVEEIAGVKNNKDFAWTYFINGQSPGVTADKYELKEGDLVEWRYIKPEL